MKKVKFDNEGIKGNPKTHMLMIVLKEGKGSAWRWVKDTNDHFSIDENTYFVINKGTYLNKTVRFSIYLEGISIPINHGYIEKETKTVTLKDSDTGKETKHKLQGIKGLKFDSKLIDMLLNRHLADEFTKNHFDTPNFLIVIMLLINIIIALINIGMWFK